MVVGHRLLVVVPEGRLREALEEDLAVPAVEAQEDLAVPEVGADSAHPEVGAGSAVERGGQVAPAVRLAWVALALAAGGSVRPARVVRSFRPPRARRLLSRGIR